MTRKNDSTTTARLSDLATLLPEPPCGSVLIDGDGTAWQRAWDSDQWFAACAWDQPMTWAQIIVHLGVAHVFPRSAAVAYRAAELTAEDVA